MENLLRFVRCVCVHKEMGIDRCVFIRFKVMWLCSSWADICYWSHLSRRDASLYGWDLFLHFPGINDSLFPEKECFLCFSFNLSLSTGPTLTTCACISSLNDSVNVPHQRMSHSTTLLLWWFLPSVYYIMQKVLRSYIYHNKHSASALV